MANLNANRNLPPDSTAWGKALDRRVGKLESMTSTVQSNIRNTQKGLSSLNDRVGSISNAVGSSGSTRYDLNSSGQATSAVGPGRIVNDSPFEIPVMAPGPVLEMESRTGILSISGLISVGTSASASIDNEAQIFVGIAVGLVEQGDNWILFPDVEGEGGNNGTFVFVKSASRIYGYDHNIPIHFATSSSNPAPTGDITIQPVVWTRLWDQSNTVLTTDFPRISVISF